MYLFLVKVICHFMSSLRNHTRKPLSIVKKIFSYRLKKYSTLEKIATLHTNILYALEKTFGHFISTTVIYAITITLINYGTSRKIYIQVIRGLPRPYTCNVTMLMKFRNVLCDT